MHPVAGRITVLSLVVMARWVISKSRPLRYHKAGRCNCRHGEKAFKFSDGFAVSARVGIEAKQSLFSGGYTMPELETAARESTPAPFDLVCPAGSLPALKAAVDEGADCVYMGFRDATNARNFAGLNFNDKTMQEGIAYAHAHDCK